MIFFFFTKNEKERRDSLPFQHVSHKKILKAHQKNNCISCLNMNGFFNITTTVYDRNMNNEN